MRIAPTLVLIGALALADMPALAHGVAWTRAEAQAVVLDFRYSDGEAMAFAEVVVQAPGHGPRTQTGRTDRNGRFAFVPDMDGEWSVRADDGTGHVLTATPAIAGGHYGGETRFDPFQNSLLRDGWTLRTGFGLSLLLNLTLAALWRRARRPSRPR